jgi:hypothetical protein
VVPIALDAPLTVSVIGQLLLARWKSSAWRRWRLFAVTLVTAPLSLAGNALRGALVFDGPAGEPGRLDLALLDLHRPEVWIRLIAAMVPSIGVILAVAVTELVLREHARLEELREAARDTDLGASDWEREAAADERDQRTVPMPRQEAKRADPRALRVARAGGDWKKVAAATGLGEHAAKRALTAARKQIVAESQSPPAPVADAPTPSPAATDGEAEFVRASESPVRRLREQLSEAAVPAAAAGAAEG